MILTSRRSGALKIGVLKIGVLKIGAKDVASALSQQGWNQAAIVQALGVTEGAVSQWLASARTEGVAALKKRASPGAPPKLTREQKAQLPQLLLRGAPAFGFTGDVWTAERVATVIEQDW